MSGFLGQVQIRGAKLGQNEPPWSIEREIKKKEQQCYFLRITYNSAVAKYYQDDTTDDYYENILEPARLDLNTCIDELNELIDTADYGPRVPVNAVWAPFKPQEMEDLPTPPTGTTTPEEPETFASAPWPSEIPKPTTEPIPATEPEVAPPIDCDPMKGEFFDPSTGQCRGSVKSGYSGFSAIGPATTSASSFAPMNTSPSTAFMSGRRIKTAPLLVGRF